MRLQIWKYGKIIVDASLEDTKENLGILKDIALINLAFDKEELK